MRKFLHDVVRRSFRAGKPRKVLALVLLSGGLVPWDGSAAPESVSTPEQGWLLIGTFKGATTPGLFGRLSDLLFEYERDDSLFRDLGDLGVGVGIDFDDVSVDWDWYFRRRVVQAHEDIPVGETIAGEDLSLYRNINAARQRLKVSWAYLPDLVEDYGIGMEVEGGFAVALARATDPRVQDDEASETDVLTEPRQEIIEFFAENDVNLKDHGIVYVTVGSLAGVVDGTAGAIGNRLANTEKAAIYWDNYADSVMSFYRSGLPLQLRVFMGDDPTLAAGDSVTFTTFAALSPVVAGIRKYGARISYKDYGRLLRETTVVKESDSKVRVRVRNWRGLGHEMTPFKLRPELRIIFFKLGYTLFESVLDQFAQKVSDVVYRLDLESPDGLDLFRRILQQSGKVQMSPEVFDFGHLEGVDILQSEVERGRVHNWRVRANFFSWFRYMKRQLASTGRIDLKDAELREVTRVRTREFRKTIGKDRDVKTRSIITIQSDVDWDREEPGKVEDERIAIEVVTNHSDRYASAEEMRNFGGMIETVLNLSESDTVLENLKQAGFEGEQQLSFNLALNLGARETLAMADASEDEIWSALGDVLLGDPLGDAWSTETKRFWWKAGAPRYTEVTPAVPHVSVYYDQLRAYERPSQRSRQFLPDEYPSQRLYQIAAKAVRKFEKLQGTLRPERDCLSCILRAYSSSKDLFLIQSLATRLAEGADGGAVGYTFTMRYGEMAQPRISSNGVTHGYRLPRGEELIPNAEAILDSPPRLRAAQLALRVVEAESDQGDPDLPCLGLRLLADHRFAEDLRLRINWREVRTSKKDESRRVVFLPLGRPMAIDEVSGLPGTEDYVTSPEDRAFAVDFGVGRQLGSPYDSAIERARFAYELELPWLPGMSADKRYRLVLRMVNAAGLPVSEEQELMMRLPKEWRALAPASCVETADRLASLAVAN